MHIGVEFGGLLAQSVAMQQALVGRQVAPQRAKPFAQVVLHDPVPEQTKLLPHAAGGGRMQLPPAHVPAPTRFTPEHMGLSQETVG